MNGSATEPTKGPIADRIRTLAITLTCALIAIVATWQLSMHASLARVLLVAALVLPLCAPLPGLIRRNRRTYAWATLCVIPYFVLGLTETIANPQSRAWAAVCLVMALVLFGTLIGYLRVTK